MTRYIYLLLFIGVFSFSYAQQSQEELEQRKAKLQAEIQEKERMLQDIKSKELSVTKVLQLQKEKIALKEKLIQMSEKQSKVLKNDMYTNQVQINHLNSDLTDLKKDYAEMIVKSYKSRSTQSRATFLLSSESFTQAYKRLQYMKHASLMSREQRIARFTENHLDHLKRDISVGHGEYLSSLPRLMQIETAQRPAFFAFVQGNFTRLFPSAQTRAADMLAALDREMRADPRFAERVALN